MRIPYISVLAAGALALGGCAYGGLGGGLGYGDPYYSGYGYGSPYYGSGYGRSGVSVSIGTGYGGYGYGSPYYGGYGYNSPFGWYNNYYYPGTGYYVYDRYRRPYSMTTTQRNYWASRSPALRTSGTRTAVRENWSGFSGTQSTSGTSSTRTKADRVRRTEATRHHRDRD